MIIPKWSIVKERIPKSDDSIVRIAITDPRLPVQNINGDEPGIYHANVNPHQNCDFGFEYEMKTTRGKWTFTVDLQKYTVSQIDTILKYVYYDVSHAIEHREITLEDKKYELGLVIDDLNEDMNKFAEEWP